MTKALDFLHRYRWLVFAAAALALAAWVVVVGFGEALGVDPGVRSAVAGFASKAWTGLMTIVGAIALRDRDGDGVPDLLQGGDK